MTTPSLEPSPQAYSADGTPIFRQRNPKWGGRTLGTGSSISAAGCAMCSVAMAISKISGRLITPDVLDAHLDAYGGYAGNAIVWDRAAKLAGLSARKAPWSLATVDEELAAGRPVVLGVDYKAGSRGGKNGTDHWVCLTQKEQGDRLAQYCANDPATGDAIRLYEAMGGHLAGGPQNYRTSGELVVFSGK